MAEQHHCCFNVLEFVLRCQARLWSGLSHVFSACIVGCSLHAIPSRCLVITALERTRQNKSYLDVNGGSNEHPGERNMITNEAHETNHRDVVVVASRRHERTHECAESSECLRFCLSLSLYVPTCLFVFPFHDLSVTPPDSTADVVPAILTTLPSAVV